MSTAEILLQKLGERLQQQLPGTSAHEVMRAIPVGSLRPKFEHAASPKPGSVLILIYPDEQDIRFPLIKRPDYSGLHSGQVSLPGGKAEHGENAAETALREAQEEIGVDISKIQVVGKLSEFFVIPSNFMITPVVALAHEKPVMIPDTREVAKILTASVFDLLDEQAIKSKEIIAAGRYALQAPHFEVEGEVVWGATAMMLNEFRVVCGEILLDVGW